MFGLIVMKSDKPMSLWMTSFPHHGSQLDLWSVAKYKIRHSDAGADGPGT